MADEQIGLEGRLDLSQWERGVETYTGSIDRMNSKNMEFIRSAGDEYAKLGGIITGAATAAVMAATAIGTATGAAIIGWTAEGVGMAADLQSQISGIAAVMGETREEVEPLADLISDLSLDPSLKVNTTEAADAIELLARNGVNLTDILDGAARNTVLLANATDADFGTAADLATDVMSIFNIEAKDMQSAVNGITSVVNNSKFTIDDYRLALSRGGSQAEAAGVSFDDFNAIIAFSASAFSSGQTAGTGWANLLTRLVPQTENAEAAMKELGIITADGANQFFTANGEMKEMGDVIDILNGAFGGLSEEQRIAYAQTIFGRDAAAALNSVIGKSSIEFLNFKGILGNTDAEESARTRMDNLAGAIEILLGQLEAIQIQVGDKFQNVVKQWTQSFSGVLEGSADDIIGFFGVVAEWAEQATAALLPIVEEWLPRLIDNAIALGQWLIEAARSGEVWNEWLDELDPTLRTWIERMLHVGAAMAEVNGKIGEIVAWVTQAIAPVTDFIAEFVEWEDVLYAAAGAVAAFLAPLALAAVKMAAVGAAATVAVALIRDAWENNLGGVRDFVAQVWTQIQGIVATGIEIVQTLWGGHSTELGTLATNAWENIKGIISGALTIVQGVMNTILAAVQGDWETVWANIANAAATIWEGIKTTWNTALAALTQYLTDHWPTWSTKLGEWAQAAWQWIVDAAGIVGEKLGEWFTTLTTWLGENIDDWMLKLGEWAAAAWQWIVDAAALLPEKLDEWYTALDTWVTENLPAWQTKMEEWGTAAVEALKPVGEWLDTTFPSATAEAQLAWENFLSRYQELKTEFQSASDEIAAIWETLTGLVGADAVTMTELIDGAFANLLETVRITTDQVVLPIKLMLQVIQGDWEGAWGTIGEITASGADNMVLEILARTNPAVAAATEVGDAIGEGIAAPFEDENNPAFQAAESFGGTLKSVLENAGLGAMVGWIEGFTANSNDAVEAAGSMADDVQKEVEESLDIHSPSGKFMGFAEQSIEGFRKGFVDNIHRATEAATQMITQFMEKFDVILSKLPLVAKDAMVEFVQMFRSGMDAALGLAEARAMDFLRKFDIIIDQLPRLAQETMAQFVEAMAQGYARVLADTESFVHRLNGIFSSMLTNAINTFTTTGQQAGQGFINGIDSKIGEAQAKVAQLGDLAAQALATSLEAQSPSRRTQREGENAGQGFINGILAKVKDAQYAAAQLGDAAAQALAAKAYATADYALSLGATPTGNPQQDMAAAMVAAYERAGQSLTERNAEISAANAANYARLTGQAWSGGGDPALAYYGQQAPATVQSYATTNNMSNQVGPNYISTPFDWAEMEFRMRRIVAESM